MCNLYTAELECKRGMVHKLSRRDINCAAVSATQGPLDGHIDTQHWMTEFSNEPHYEMYSVWKASDRHNYVTLG